MSFEALTANYFIFSLFYAFSAYIGYGILPILFSKIGLTNNEYVNKKHELVKRKSTIINFDPFKDHTDQENLNKIN